MFVLEAQNLFVGGSLLCLMDMLEKWLEAARLFGIANDFREKEKAETIGSTV